MDEHLDDFVRSVTRALQGDVTGRGIEAKTWHYVFPECVCEWPEVDPTCAAHEPPVTVTFEVVS